MASVPLIMTLLVMGLTLVNSDSPEVIADDLNDEVEPMEGPTAELKPLLPVAGTNLFYNLPYRWFDETKPGCFVTWFWETFQVTKENKNRGVSVACNNADQQEWYNTTNADWIIESPKEGLTHTHGNIVFRNVGAGYTLERLDSSGTSWLAVDGYSARMHMFDIHTWNILSDPNNKNRVQLEIDGKTLAQHPLPSHRAYLYVKEGYADGYPYTFVPSISLELKITNFDFTRPLGSELAKHTSQKALIDEYTINNNSPGTASRKIEVSETVRQEFSYGFSQSIKNALKVSGSVGIPLVAEGKVENTFEQQLGANQNWKSATDKTFKLSYDVNVPPNTEIRISAWYDLINDLRMDFTATVEVFGKTNRVTRFDDIVQDVPATGDMIRKQLENSGFDGVILQTKNNFVLVQVKGSMVATAGVRGRLNMNGETVRTSEPL